MAVQDWIGSAELARRLGGGLVPSKIDYWRKQGVFNVCLRRGENGNFQYAWPAARGAFGARKIRDTKFKPKDDAPTGDMTALLDPDSGDPENWLDEGKLRLFGEGKWFPKPQHMSAVKAFIEAQTKAMEFEKERGSLLRREVMERELFTIVRGVRDRVLSVPARTAPILASISDPAEVDIRLRKELQECLEALQSAFKRFEPVQ